MLKIEVSALNEGFKNLFSEFVSTTVVFSVVIPLRTLVIVHSL
jgi:hypothetical protein